MRDIMLGRLPLPLGIKATTLTYLVKTMKGRGQEPYIWGYKVENNGVQKEVLGKGIGLFVHNTPDIFPTKK